MQATEKLFERKNLYDNEKQNQIILAYLLSKENQKTPLSRLCHLIGNTNTKDVENTSLK